MGGERAREPDGFPEWTPSSRDRRLWQSDDLVQQVGDGDNILRHFADA